jgi:histone-lysine N-methyltransferase SETMAR
MEKSELHAVIKFFFLKKLSTKVIHAEMVNILGDNAVSHSLVKKWVARFKSGNESTKDGARTGRPTSSVNEDHVKQVESMVLNDRRVTVRHVAETLRISIGSAETILTNHLSMKKVSARCVPRMLTPEQKQNRCQISQQLLQRYQADPDDFLSRLVTQDETWVHHFDPESKRQSLQWKHPWSPSPRKFRVVASARKVMASVFWDSEGVIVVDYLEHGHTITGEYYSQLLIRLREAIKQKRRGKLSRGVIMLQDNAPAHTSHVATATIDQCSFELLPHPPYSPDLAPSDYYYLFPLLKEHLRGKHYGSDEVINAVEQWINGQERDFFLKGQKKLESRWQKCVDVLGDYLHPSSHHMPCRRTV